MNAPKANLPADRRHRGYLIVLFVIIVAFVGVAASMQVLVLTSVATTSRAYDTYRQGTSEMARLECAVTEAILDQRQVSVAGPTGDLGSSLTARVAEMSAGGATITMTSACPTLPAITVFPSTTVAPDPLISAPANLNEFLSPELLALAGPHVADYPEMSFDFASVRNVLGAARTYRTRVRARIVAVPLTRFPVVAYDLPAEIGVSGSVAGPPAVAGVSLGLVPSRDPSVIVDLQAQPGTLPYPFRRRVALAAAYQYVFSQAYIDRAAEYAGITHFRNLDAAGATADLVGMSQAGPVTRWDVGLAGSGTYGSITLTRDAAVVFAERAGNSLSIYDSVGASTAPALCLFLLGPSDSKLGPLTVDIGSVARPLLVIGYNIRVTAAAGVALNGGLLLDPTSQFAPAGSFTVGHLSYWAGASATPLGTVSNSAMPATAEALAPRVVYVATIASRE